MTVFTMPRVDYRVDLPARSQLSYASLDAQMSIGPEPYQVGYSELELSGVAELVAVSTHLVTRAVMDPDSERQSRVLESEAVLVAPNPSKSSLVYLTTGTERSWISRW